MEKRKHYWNGRWGRIARLDIMVYEDAGQWSVERRVGGVEGRSQVTEHTDEDAALDRLRDLLAGADDWRELP
jgi:phage gp37-like protein